MPRPRAQPTKTSHEYLGRLRDCGAGPVTQPTRGNHRGRCNVRPSQPVEPPKQTSQKSMRRSSTLVSCWSLVNSWQSAQHLQAGRPLAAGSGAAVDLLQRPLPLIRFQTVLALLCDFSGLLALGTKTAASDCATGANQPVRGMVLRSGGAKTPVKQTLVDAPAIPLRDQQSDRYEDAVERWRDSCKGKKKDDAQLTLPTLPH